MLPIVLSLPLPELLPLCSTPTDAANALEDWVDVDDGREIPGADVARLSTEWLAVL